MRSNSVKQALKEGKPSVGTWLSLGNIIAARFLARAGFSWLTVDIEHTLVDWETATHMLASIADAGCIALARVPCNSHENIKRALDNGAHGIVVPMVNTVEEAARAVDAVLYPPRGTRSVGGSVHALNFGTDASDYFAHADDEILIVLQCEHIQAVEHADEVFSVPGIDAIFVGPNDLAASMRGRDGSPPSATATRQAMKHILDTCQKHKVAAGLHCANAEEALQRIAEGWQFIAIGSDLRLMMAATGATIKQLGADAGVSEMARY